MKNITDKELLTFCNLTNLKMEFATLKYKKYDNESEEESDKEKEINHTIYTTI